jgi:hypothetical protein
MLVLAQRRAFSFEPGHIEAGVLAPGNFDSRYQ